MRVRRNRDPGGDQKILRRRPVGLQPRDKFRGEKPGPIVPPLRTSRLVTGPYQSGKGWRRGAMNPGFSAEVTGDRAIVEYLLTHGCRRSVRLAIPDVEDRASNTIPARKASSGLPARHRRDFRDRPDATDRWRATIEALEAVVLAAPGGATAGWWAPLNCVAPSRIGSIAAMCRSMQSGDRG